MSRLKSPHADRPLPPPPSEAQPKRRPTSKEEIEQLTKAISKDVKTEHCQQGKCNRPFELYCRKCKQLLCYRCSRGECKAGKKHETEDFEEYLAAHKQRYEMWKAGKKNRSINLDQEIRALSLRIKTAGHKLAIAPLSTVHGCAQETLQTLTMELQTLENMNRELEGNFFITEQFNLQIKQLSDVGFIKLVEALTITDECHRCKKFNLGTFDTMKTSTIEHLTLTPEANAMLASNFSQVLLFNSSSTQSMGTIPIIGHVVGFHSYNGYLYVAANLNGAGDRIAVYDQQYAQSRHWVTPMNSCDLTVNNEKVYLAGLDKKIHVYSTYGTRLYEITEAVGTRLASHPLADIILVTNYEKNRVYGVNGNKREVLWSSEVDTPWGVAIDEYEAVWVWSESQQNLTIFDDKGTKKQEIEHPKLTGIGDVTSICIKNGKLWVGFEGGLHRFQIGYY